VTKKKKTEKNVNRSEKNITRQLGTLRLGILPGSHIKEKRGMTVKGRSKKGKGTFMGFKENERCIVRGRTRGS